MIDRERQELAIDIAKRVRLLTVQTVPKWFLDLLVPAGRQVHTLYTARPARDYVKVEYEERAGALHITISVNDTIVARIRLDGDDQVRPEFV